VTKADADPVKSADRVLDVLEFLAQSRRPLQHTELSELLAIPKSSLSKLLRNLVTRDYVAYTPFDKGYTLGPRLANLLREATADLDLADIARPALEEVTAVTRESASLNLLRGDTAEVVVCINGPQRLNTQMRLGDVAPLYATSGGKAILAFMPESWRRDYAARVTFTAITDKTLTSVAALMDQVAAIRADGLAYSFDEFTPGVTGIAKPILSDSGIALASINVTIPSARYGDAARSFAIEALNRAALIVSRRLRR
jgi:DNA-binding IclR family transcriptional regulator